mmetsp:Transcript_41206/g.89803  ORF Transcript_41206/g.89803 Transcript_41206/m.89803 type:complete len:265 (-) Transcript_41206:100-894(-)
MQASQHDGCGGIDEPSVLAEIVHESDLVPHFVAKLLTAVLGHTLCQSDGGHTSGLRTDHHLVLRHQVRRVTDKLRNQCRLAAPGIPGDYGHLVPPHSRADELPLLVSGQCLRECGHRWLPCKPSGLILELLVFVRARHKDCSFRPQTPLIVHFLRGGCRWGWRCTLAGALCRRSLARGRGRGTWQNFDLHCRGVVAVLLLQLLQDTKKIHHTQLNFQWFILKEVPQPLERQRHSIHDVPGSPLRQLLHLVHHILDVLVQLLRGR